MKVLLQCCQQSRCCQALVGPPWWQPATGPNLPRKLVFKPNSRDFLLPWTMLTSLFRQLCLRGSSNIWSNEHG